MCQQFAAAARGRSSPRSWEGAALPEPPLRRAPAGGSSRAAPARPPRLRPRSAQAQSAAKGSEAFNL